MALLSQSRDFGYVTHTHAKVNLVQTNKFPVSQTRVGLVIIYTRNIVKSCLITQY